MLTIHNTIWQLIPQKDKPSNAFSKLHWLESIPDLLPFTLKHKRRSAQAQVVWVTLWEGAVIVSFTARTSFVHHGDGAREVWGIRNEWYFGGGCGVLRWFHRGKGSLQQLVQFFVTCSLVPKWTIKYFPLQSVGLILAPLFPVKG